jgi:hypothetical protein
MAFYGRLFLEALFLLWLIMNESFSSTPFFFLAFLGDSFMKHSFYAFWKNWPRNIRNFQTWCLEAYYKTSFSCHNLNCWSSKAKMGFDWGPLLRLVTLGILFNTLLFIKPQNHSYKHYVSFRTQFLWLVI